MYCYRRHSSPQISQQLPRLRLLSAAHFPAQRHRAGIVIHGTIPGFTGIFPHFFKSHRVVIRHTIRGDAGCVAGVVIIGTFCGMGCYPWHIFHFVDFLLCVLLSPAQFRKNPLAAFSGGCYPPHNFCRTRRGQGCYPQHSFDSGNFFVWRCYARHISEFRTRCCYQRHNSLLFRWGCYSAHNSPKILCRAGCWNARHCGYSRHNRVGTHGTFQKSCFVGCYRRHNLIFPQESCRRIFAEKIFFCVVTPRTWLFPAQLCGYSRHNRVGTHGTFLL